MSPSCWSRGRTGHHTPAAAQSGSWEMRNIEVDFLNTSSLLDYLDEGQSVLTSTGAWHFTEYTLITTENIDMNGKSIFSHLKLDNSIASSPVTSVYKHYFVIMLIFFEICDNDDNASDKNSPCWWVLCQFVGLRVSLKQTYYAITNNTYIRGLKCHS